MTALADAAVDYAKRGLEIFPLNADKTPATAHGFLDATSNPDQIETWWRLNPQALIGCRVPDGYMILDLDPRHGGVDTMRQLAAEHGQLPITRRHKSGRGDGGGHIWLERPEGKLTTRHIPGVDLLHHDLRYTILPPSPHPATGQPYIWSDATGYGPDEIIAPCPTWLAELLHAPDPTPPPPAVGRIPGDRLAGENLSPIERFKTEHTLEQYLTGRGWQQVGDNRWRHPTATSTLSATVRDGRLYNYSDNNGLPVTEHGYPQGLDVYDLYVWLEHGGNHDAALQAIRPAPAPQWATANVDPNTGEIVDDPLPVPIDWPTFWTGDPEPEPWLIEPILVKGRGHALYAPAKTGKSLLVFELAAALATGRAVLHQPAQQPEHVIYLDYEMTVSDVRERLEAMGYDDQVDLSHLHYFLIPSLPPLDTQEGGAAVIQLVERYGASIVIIDTTGRAVDGEENDGDTFRHLYRHTGMQLKSRGVATLRIDHAGKDITKGQRGSSGKNDDVDLVFQLTVSGDALLLKTTHKRVGWVPSQLEIYRYDEPLRHVLADRQWHPNTPTVAAALDRIGVPLDASERAAGALMRSSGEKASQKLLREALQWRRLSKDAI